MKMRLSIFEKLISLNFFFETEQKKKHSFLCPHHNALGVVVGALTIMSRTQFLGAGRILLSNCQRSDRAPKTVQKHALERLTLYTEASP